MRASGLLYDKQGQQVFLMSYVYTEPVLCHMKVNNLFYAIKGQQIVRMPQEGNKCALYHMRATIIIENMRTNNLYCVI